MPELAKGFALDIPSSWRQRELNSRYGHYNGLNASQNADWPREIPMPVFVVVVKRGANTVQERIAELPKKSVRALTDDAWLIDYDGTTKECAESMGIRGEESDASGIAFAVSNYSGRFSTDAWEWLRLHMTRGDI